MKQKERNETSSNEVKFFNHLGFRVVELGDKKLALVEHEISPVFLSWFSSPIGLELLDVRVPVLFRIPNKSPNLLALIEGFGPISLGQWMFGGDDDQGYNLSFGLQMSRDVLSKETMSSSLSFLGEVQKLGISVLEAIAGRPEDFPDFEGVFSVGPDTDEQINQ